MKRGLLVIAISVVTLSHLGPAAKAESEAVAVRGWEPIAFFDADGRGRSATPKTKGGGIVPTTHDQFKVDAAISGASLTQGPHENTLSIDYRASSNADTLYWSNNKALSGTASLIGSFSLWTVTDGCPASSTNFASFSHTEYAVKIMVNYTDNVGNPWTFENQYWHMGSYSTGTKSNGASFGTQATHPISGCKYYYAPGYGWHGQLASTGAHIHHYAKNANTYTTSPIRLIWTMLSH